MRDIVTEKLENTAITKSLYYVRGDKNKGIRYTEASAMTIQNTICRYLKLNYAGKDFVTSEPTAEAILQLNPDYFVVGGAYQNTIINTAKSDNVWQSLSAFQNNNVFNIGVGFVMFEQNGVELTLYLADLANKIYPELFNFDIEQMVIDTMQKYFGVAISNADAQNMLKGLKRNGTPLA